MTESQTLKQISFLDNFIKVYHFSGIQDYESKISHKHFESELDDFLDKVNYNIPQIRKLFHTSKLNLARKKVPHRFYPLGLQLVT